MPNKYTKGTDVAITQGVKVNRGGVFERNINAVTVDKSGKQNGKNLILLKINNRMMDFEANGQEEILNIMQAGIVEIEVNNRKYNVKPSYHVSNPTTGKTEIYFQKVV